MPISTSVITGTVAHNHSLASAEGGWLSEGNTGTTGGNAGEVWTQQATNIPTWAAGAAAGIWSADGTSTTSGASSLSVTGMDGRDITQVLFHVGTESGENALLQMRVNGISTGTYCSRFYDSNGDNSNVNNINQYRLTGTLTGQDFCGEVLIFKGDPNMSWTGNQIRTSISCLNAIVSTPHTHEIIMGSGNQPDTNAITQVEMMVDNGDIIGTIQVNSMDYQ